MLHAVHIQGTGSLKGDHWEDLDADVTIILKLIVMKQMGVYGLDPFPSEWGPVVAMRRGISFLSFIKDRTFLYIINELLD